MANISHFTQTVSGVSTTYDIHDANAVDLTNNQTVGGIKTFSNAPVVGSINLDGKTIDTDANDNMTFNGHKVDTIEEQGNGYIRYSNGLQICWTTNALVTQSSSGTWTYPKTFISVPCIWWQAIGNNTAYVDAVNSGDVSPSNAVFMPSRYMDGSVVTAPYGVNGLAIGRWK